MLKTPIGLCENLIDRYFALLDNWKAHAAPEYETMVMTLDDYYSLAKTDKVIEIRDNRTGVRVAFVRADTFAKEAGRLLERYLALYFGREP